MKLLNAKQARKITEKNIDKPINDLIKLIKKAAYEGESEIRIGDLKEVHFVRLRFEGFSVSRCFDGTVAISW